MSTYTPARQRLADALKARDIARIVYFHTDHFEPWRSYAGQPSIGARNAGEIALFAEAMQRIDFARRLTLFYKTSYNFGLRDGHDVIRNAGDRLGFMRRSGEETEVANAAIGYLARETGHEIQLHVHHENFTWNTSQGDPEIKAWLATPEGRARDDDRFELALKIYLASLEEETGLAFPRWFFVHGHWALNASDTKDCNITREIEILQRNGCLGDFTFPAGRPHVDAFAARRRFQREHEQNPQDAVQTLPNCSFASRAEIAVAWMIH